jgi:arylsulfatase A
MKLAGKLILLWVLSLVLGMPRACQQEAHPPNIIVILADDLGYGDLHAFGSNHQDTPHLDRMAREGLVFTDFHSNGAVCSPTRAALLTGQYQQRVGIENVVHAKHHRHTGMSTSAYTLADHLSASAYATALFGKWHLGYDTLYSPLNFGFERFRGFVSGNVDYHAHIDGEGYFDWWHQKDTLREQGYTTDLITGHAIDYILEQRDRPFFMYVAHEAPHFPYQGRKDPAIRTPGHGSLKHHRPEDRGRTYREMIAAMDQGIGAILRALEDSEQLSNTLVFFFSDNGASDAGSNHPFRGYKASLWEGGHRVPAMAYWPGRIEAGSSDDFLVGMDLFPTLAAVAGHKVSPDLALDGRDFSSLLWGGEGPGERAVCWRFKNQAAVRRGPWKLIRVEEEHFLYLLPEDSGEIRNLSDDHQDITRELLKHLADWEAEMEAYVLNEY